jgi:FAD/FMN-containing dehydrogenase
VSAAENGLTAGSSRLKRRDFLKAISAAPLLATPALNPPHGTLVNDIHTGWNKTLVDRVEQPTSPDEVLALIRAAEKHGKIISVSGSRHATGGQQFALRSLLVDTRRMNRIVDLDTKSSVLSVEGGIEWPDLIQGYLKAQTAVPSWGIRQKQGGGDRMTIGGALSANAHGHCLGAPPIVNDVEWIEIATADKIIQKCSRSDGKELFSLAIGGYGLFGIITAVGLRLVPRRKVRRNVEALTLAEASGTVEKRAANGTAFGYFQYNTDETSLEFMRTGILTTYDIVSDETPMGDATTDIDEAPLANLLELAHKDRRSAYRHYATFELSKSGNVEWSDLHQLSSYPSGYHIKMDARHTDQKKGADLIWEFYVPRADLIAFLEEARRLLLKSETPLIYGTVRFIEQDRDSFLAWAKKRYACVIFTPHFADGVPEKRKAGELYRQLAQAATKRGGSFYLTYNRFAGRNEMDSAYPQFAEFLRLKRKYDPGELFQSEWYRHYRDLYA